MERLALGIMVSDELIDALRDLLDAGERAAPNRLSVINAKKRSTWFSQELCRLGVQRGIDQLGHPLVVDGARCAWANVIVQAGLNRTCAAS